VCNSVGVTVLGHQVTKKLRGFGVKVALKLAVCAVLFVPFNAHAGTLPEIIAELVSTHESVLAAQATADASRERARVALGDWFPTLDVTANYGNQQIDNPSSDDTNMVSREADLKVTQLLWDFGSTNAALRIAKYNLESSLLGVESATQDILMSGIAAYLNVLGNHEVVAYARKSVEKIKEQSQLETDLVEAGKGYATNVLEAKAKLSEAESRRVVAEGELEIALHEYYRVFGHDYEDGIDSVRPKLRIELMPITLEEAIEISVSENPELLAEVTKVKIAELEITTTRADSFYPTFEAIAEANYKRDVDGTAKFKRELLGKVEMNFPFNLGFTAINSLRASNKDKEATTYTYKVVRDNIEKTTRDSWSNLKTKTAQLHHLNNAAELSARFLEGARKEYKDGAEQRTLTEILGMEVALFSSLSAAAKAETDQAIAFYSLLRQMGKLDQKMFALNSN